MTIFYESESKKILKSKLKTDHDLLSVFSITQSFNQRCPLQSGTFFWEQMIKLLAKVVTKWLVVDYDDDNDNDDNDDS